MPALRSLHVLTAAVAFAAAAAARPAAAELFFDVGAHVTRFYTDIPEGPKFSTTETSPHLAVGVRRALPSGNDIGVRLEAELLDSNAYLAFRVFDYRLDLSERLRLGFFFGAARLDTGEAAFGWYFGTGVQFKELLPAWDLGVDLRFGDSLQRDNVLPTDQPITGPRSDTFYEADGISVYLSRGFGGRRSSRAP